MLSERLKAETAAEHAALEKEMMPLLREAVNAQSYTQLLQGMYRFLALLEAGAHQSAPKSLLPDLDRRRGMSWMAEDLNALGTMPLFVDEKEVPQITSVNDVWGALYLLEGSTLGGQIITKILQKKLPQEVQKLAYFGGYGAETGAMWNAFKEHLDAYGEANPEAQDAVIAFSRKAFSHFQKSLAAYKKTL